RYRLIASFGRAVIRKFARNASAMKRLGARDFEDLLQCAMPVFNGLLPEPHNSYVQDLLFDLATWHAYAKLRLHTTDTLNFFDNAVTSLGVTARRFLNKTCEAYYTRELPQETAVRGRRVAVLAAKNGVPVPSGTGEAKRKRLNLQTYKYHALADYPNTIRLRGTTDSYSTQPVYILNSGYPITNHSSG
ncbi:hypothetical protein EV363DRAFT_1181249, partial [Boletus edulis]